MSFIDPRKQMGAYSIMDIGLLLIGVLQRRGPGIWAVFLRSFFMSLMFPTFASGLRGLGPNTKLEGSFLVMGIVGGAVITPLMGWVSMRNQSVATAYTVPLVGYVLWPCMPM